MATNFFPWGARIRQQTCASERNPGLPPAAWPAPVQLGREGAGLGDEPLSGPEQVSGFVAALAPLPAQEDMETRGLGAGPVSPTSVPSFSLSPWGLWVSQIGWGLHSSSPTQAPPCFGLHIPSDGEFTLLPINSDRQL